MVDLGERKLKGFSIPVRAWRIASETDAEGRFDAQHGVATPLVGRAEELELLMQRWQLAQAGKGQAVLLSGEPGIGKSRLIAALLERLDATPHTRLRYFCSPYHVNSALHPVIKQLERPVGLRRDDSTDTMLDKLETLLRQAISDIAEVCPFAGRAALDRLEWSLCALAADGASAEAPTLSALIQLLEGLATRKPAMMLIEDAHWIDPTTSEWLDMVIDKLQVLPVVLIVTFRPEFQPRWTLSSNVAALSLNRLGRDEGAAIVDRVAGGKSLPLEVRNQILARTEGVSLFIEELTKTVLESSLLVDEGDHYVLSGPLPSLAIPSTLQDSLMARLDRLSQAKEVAQIAACVAQRIPPSAAGRRDRFR